MKIRILSSYKTELIDHIVEGYESLYLTVRLYPSLGVNVGLFNNELLSFVSSIMWPKEGYLGIGEELVTVSQMSNKISAVVIKLVFKESNSNKFKEVILQELVYRIKQYFRGQGAEIEWEYDGSN
jgi:hypothetical protein